jgi:flagellar basal body rod protein FlgF
MTRNVRLFAGLVVVVLAAGCRNDGIHAPKQPPPTPVARNAAEALIACDCGEPDAMPSPEALDQAIRITRDNLDHAEIAGFKSTRAMRDAGVARLQLDAGQGAIERTGRELDVAISGNGFFALQTPAGIRYTRNGNFFQDPAGQIVSSDGHPVMPPIFVLPSQTDLTICVDGSIVCLHRTIALLRLYRFAHPDRMRRDNDGLLIPTADSGEAIQGSPAEADPQFGAILQTFLEGSNVNAAQERKRLDRLLHWRDSRGQSTPKP